MITMMMVISSAMFTSQSYEDKIIPSVWLKREGNSLVSKNLYTNEVPF
jgi:hypothetical protein